MTAPTPCAPAVLVDPLVICTLSNWFGNVIGSVTIYGDTVLVALL